MKRCCLPGSSLALSSSGCRVIGTRHFAQLITSTTAMITKPESPEPFIGRVNRKRHVLPASWMRSGTSKGLFIHRKHLPLSEEAWSPLILAAMGSNHADPRQLNGIGGATSTTSKVAIVSPSARPGIDVEYTFAQVAVGKNQVDYSGNCGNIASGVGPFALEEGIVEATPGQKQVDVRIMNTNTGCILMETVAVDEEGFPLEQGDYRIAGVSDPGTEIKVAFVEPAGTMTGRLFPTGNTQDTIIVEGTTSVSNTFSVEATLIDCANPFALVDATTLPLGVVQGSVPWLEMLEDIRRKAAVMMGLSESDQHAASIRGLPKLTIISPPMKGKNIESTPDLSVLSLSMGQIHPSLQLTGAVCIAAAACIEGTIPFQYCGSNQSNKLVAELKSQSAHDENSLRRARTIAIAHRSGQIPVSVRLEAGIPERCVVSRTARKLFDGNVLFYT